EAGVAIAAGDLTREPGAKGAVAVGDGVVHLGARGLGLRAALMPQPIIEGRAGRHPVAVAQVAAGRAGRADQQPAQVDARAAGPGFGSYLAQQIDTANALVE